MSSPLIEKLKIKTNALLSDYTTFKLGGACPGLINCQTPQELLEAITFLSKEKNEFILIGGGSNLVVSDKGLDCFVIRYVTDKPLIKRSGNILRVSGSTILDDLAIFAANESLEGLNYTSGIPGTVGGAVVGNAGAWGKQVGDVLKKTIVYTKDGKIKELSKENLKFTYRHSILKETNDILAEVEFELTPGNKESLLKERDEILKMRHEKHPDLEKEPCAGSFFRNIEPTSKAGKRQASGWFLEQAGGKDLKYGGAYIFDKHANIIIKGNGCKSQDVYELQALMVKLVKEKFNLELVREVRFVGEFTGKPKSLKEQIW